MGIGDFLAREWESLFKSVPKATIAACGEPGPIIRFIVGGFREMRWQALTAEGVRTAMRHHGKKAQRLRGNHAQGLKVRK
ncbi:hypothetical protein [Bradyrhizobium sp. AZCC 1678]|uniref:hypothetical protein n=1 Tax=Bradyrhizobium sp. AZCC 1678 TaxID=3117030 RepID=UPI002FF347BF